MIQRSITSCKSFILPVYRFLFRIVSTSKNYLIGFLLLSSLLFFGVESLVAQSTDLIIQKTGPTQVYAGNPMSYTITITNNGPTAVTNASFNDNFPANVFNVAFGGCTSSGGAVCPTVANYSISNTNFSGTIPSLPVNGSVTMTINLNAPSPPLTSSFSNTATVSPPSGITEIDPSTNSSTWNTTLLTQTDIKVEKTVTPDTAVSCDDLPASYAYTVKWINGGPSYANGISLNDIIRYSNTATGTGNSLYTYNYSITNLVWTSSSGTSTPTTNFSSMTGNFVLSGNTSLVRITSLSSTVPIFEPGDTIMLTFNFNINSYSVTGCGRNINWQLRNRGAFTIPSGNGLIDTVSSNNLAEVIVPDFTCNSDPCPQTDIKVEKTVTPDTAVSCDDLPASYAYTVKWINGGPSNANGISINDIIRFSNTASGTGNSLYTYNYSITNLVWTSSSGTSTPTTNFSSMTGNFVIGGSVNLVTITSLSSTVPIFEPGDTIMLTFNFNINSYSVTGCGRNINWQLRNRATFFIPSGNELVDTVSSNNLAEVIVPDFTCNSDPCPQTDIKVEKTVTPDIAVSCDAFPASYAYTVKWINGGPSNANGISIIDIIRFSNTASGTGNSLYTYNYSITNLVWTSSSGTSTPTTNFSSMTGNFVIGGSVNLVTITSLSSTVPIFEAGDTIMLTFNFNINSYSVTGCGRNINWQLRNRATFFIPSGNELVDTVSSNNLVEVIVPNFIFSSTDLAVSKSVSPQISSTGDTLTVSIQFQNASQSSTNPAIWIDTLPLTFEIAGITLTVPVEVETIDGKPVVFERPVFKSAGIATTIQGSSKQNQVKLKPGKTLITYEVSGVAALGGYIMLDFIDINGQVQSFSLPTEIKKPASLLRFYDYEI